MLHILTNSYSRIDPRFGRDSATGIELDLGCGKGSFALQLAALYSERLILGSDVMLGRLRRVARKAQRRRLDNVELLRGSNLELLAWQLPEKSVDRIHLLCPDPWPKARHRRKRLVNAEFLGKTARVLKEGGIFHFSTDVEDYYRQTESLLRSLSWFTEYPEGIKDIKGLRTDFEARWREEGKDVPRLVFRRCAN